jgi:UDP-N-acetylglucosamine 4,6-dehydratase
MNFSQKTCLITGGTGSFGKALAKRLIPHAKKVIIFSRDELKQSQMQDEDPLFLSKNVRYFLGDIRDKDRLNFAFREVDYIFHAAALKQVPAAEYNPSEFVKTNVQGTMNVIDAAIHSGVKKVIALSTDKAAAPVNLYGATKLCADKLMTSANVYVGDRVGPLFAVVRYGNVLGSRGSVIPRFNKLIQEKVASLPITDTRMTRFWITLEQAVDFVLTSLSKIQGGEIFVPKIPSMKIVDLAKAMAPNMALAVCGIRPGEKLHEVLITKEDADNTVEAMDSYIIYPSWYDRPLQDKVLPGFSYTSDSNTQWLSIEDLQNLTQEKNCLSSSGGCEWGN